MIEHKYKLISLKSSAKVLTKITQKIEIKNLVNMSIKLICQSSSNANIFE